MDLPPGFADNFFQPATAIKKRLEDTLINEAGLTRKLREVVRVAGFAGLVEGQRKSDTVYVSFFSHSITEAGSVRAGALAQQTWVTAVADENYTDTRGNSNVDDDIGYWIMQLQAVLAFYAIPDIANAKLIPTSPPTLLDPLPGYGIYPLAWTVPIRMYNDQGNRNAGLGNWTS